MELKEFLQDAIDVWAFKHGGVRAWSYARMATQIGISKSNLSLYLSGGLFRC